MVQLVQRLDTPLKRYAASERVAALCVTCRNCDEVQGHNFLHKNLCTFNSWHTHPTNFFLMSTCAVKRIAFSLFIRELILWVLLSCVRFCLCWGWLSFKWGFEAAVCQLGIATHELFYLAANYHAQGHYILKHFTSERFSLLSWMMRGFTATSAYAPFFVLGDCDIQFRDVMMVATDT